MTRPYSVLFFLICGIAVCGAGAQDRVASALDSLPTIKKIDQVAISPDGKQVAYIVEGELSVQALGGGEARRIAGEQKLAARDVAWSADSKKIVWLGDLPTDVPAAELWTASADRSGLVKVADLKGFAATPRYSPDGTRVALLYIEGMPRIAGPLQPMTPLAGVVGEKVYEQRINVVDLQTKKLAAISPADVYAYEYDWTPDSKGWVVSAAHGAGDNNWWVARLCRRREQRGDARDLQTEVADRRSTCFSGWKVGGVD
jgi:Tol biopolymer transport system component